MTRLAWAFPYSFQALVIWPSNVGISSTPNQVHSLLLIYHQAMSLWFCKCIVYPSLPPSQVGECHIWSYLEASFSSKVLPLMRDAIPWHWKLRKVNHDLPLYLFNQRSCPTVVKCIYRTRCLKITMFPCIPTWEYAWRHRRVVLNRVVSLESDRPIHNIQPSDRPSRSHDGT
jgi:hypothetical protein